MKRLKHSFINAFRGLRDLLRTQRNFLIEFTVGILVLLVAYAFRVQPMEWAILIILIIFVLAAEAANSVMENILDGVSKNFSPRFRMAKDMLAGITLLVAMASAAIGLIIFWPYLQPLISR